MPYYLIHWDESRAGQTDEWAVHDANGEEYKSWPTDPRDPDSGDGEDQVGLYQAFAEADLPTDSNLPSAARQARAIAVVQAADWSFRRESGSGPPWK